MNWGGFLRQGLVLALAGGLSAIGCSRQGALPGAAPIEVTTTTVVARDVPITMQFMGQTESSRLVEIRARVDGYLQSRPYTEGRIVRQGEVLFQIDPRPLQSTADSAAASLQDKENWAQNATKTRERMKPLLAENAISQKDYDDAVAAEKSAVSALAVARAEHARAGMNLSYARITSPLTGLAGRSSLAEGTYINPAANGLLTTIAQMDPIWVNFSVSENDWARYMHEAARGLLRFPKQLDFDVDMILSDGRVLPRQGKVNFASPSVDPQTGTFAVRATFPNADMAVSPGQFVRVRLNGTLRPGALLVPQRAVMQGQTGKFVYVVNPEGRAVIQPVELGDWHGDDWFVTSGLRGGERIVVGGIVKVQPGALLKVSEAAPAAVQGPVASQPEPKK